MNTDAETSAQPARTAAPARLARVRQASLAVLVLLVAEYVIGMYVSLYVTVPRADHGHGLGSAITNGPAMLSIHAVIGLLLGLAALGLLVLASAAGAQPNKQWPAFRVHGNVGSHRCRAAVLYGKPLPAAPAQPPQNRTICAPSGPRLTRRPGHAEWAIRAHGHPRLRGRGALVSLYGQPWDRASAASWFQFS